MKIAWLVDGVSGSWETGFTSVAASNRYRAIIPGAELRRQGHDIRFVSVTDTRWLDGYGGAAPDLVVVAKQFGWQDRTRYERISAAVIEEIERAKSRGARIVVDFCDDHFAEPVIGPHWKTLAALADLCVAGSLDLGEVVQANTSVPAHVIGDPIASPPGQPHVYQARSKIQSVVQRMLGGATANQRLRMAWYGNTGNVQALFAWADTLVPLAKECPWWLSVVTTPAASIEQRIRTFNEAHANKAIMELVPWSESAQWAAVEASDLVLIPSDITKGAKRVKSANRLTDALHMARPVFASPVPAYAPFADYAVLTNEPLQAVTAYVRDAESARLRVRRGQLAAIEHASREKIASAWLSVLALAASSEGHAAGKARSTPSSTPALEPMVKLNLGCGDKILDGYINVDVVESRAGKSPDVICDLHRLTPFADNHADEILAVHVVEHFWRWEVEAVLREWIRVLRPGGSMVLECPNLATACEEFLSNPEAGSRPDASGQRTMWVFYGDPRWKDPLMVHRWGYTPKSLASLMEQCGLVRARQEPAQYKLREPRDMRIVAEKPL